MGPTMGKRVIPPVRTVDVGVFLTVLGYVKDAIKERGVSEVEALIELNDRVARREIQLVDPNPPVVVIEYLLSFYSLWFWVLTLGLGITLSSIYLLPQITPFTWLRVLMGALTSLYFPGYAFIEALYPQKSELEELERFALGVGLSLALTPLVGFLLNYTIWGIRLNPITISITALTLLLGLVGVYRKYQYHMLSLELIDDVKVR